MKFMVYATRGGAENRSRAEAQRRGCGSDSVTQFWWEVVEGADGSFACIVGDNPDEHRNMSASDKNRLVDNFTRKLENKL